MRDQKQVHLRALLLCKSIHKQEAELLGLLQTIDDKKYYIDYGYRSLFEYVVEALRFSEHRALNFITVARMCREIPELQEEIAQGNFGVSKARKLSSVLTSENKDVWFLKAKTLSQKLLERDIRTLQPEEPVRESSRYVAADRLKICFGLSEASYEKLKRVLDLESQRKSKPAQIEDAIEAVLDFYLNKTDPLRQTKEKKRKYKTPLKQIAGENPQGENLQAENQQHRIDNEISKLPARNKVGTIVRLQYSKSGKSFVARRVKKFIRQPIPARVQQEVLLRDAGVCQFPVGRGRCGQARWIHLHHKVPVSRGGSNEAENLVTLCSTHHSWLHEKLAIDRFLRGGQQARAVDLQVV